MLKNVILCSCLQKYSNQSFVTCFTLQIHLENRFTFACHNLLNNNVINKYNIKLNRTDTGL